MRGYYGTWNPDLWAQWALMVVVFMCAVVGLITWLAQRPERAIAPISPPLHGPDEAAAGEHADEGAGGERELVSTGSRS